MYSQLINVYNKRSKYIGKNIFALGQISNNYFSIFLYNIKDASWQSFGLKKEQQILDKSNNQTQKQTKFKSQYSR